MYNIDGVILEYFLELVSKDRFLTQKDFELKMHSIFGSIYVYGSTFSYCEASHI